MPPSPSNHTPYRLQEAELTVRFMFTVLELVKFSIVTMPEVTEGVVTVTVILSPADIAMSASVKVT